MLEAVERDDHAAVAEALRHEPRRVHGFVSRSTADGEAMWLPLHVASALGSVKAARVLVEAGAVPDSRTRSQPASATRGRETAVHLAARAGDAAMIALLLEHGGSVEVLDARGSRPMHAAAFALAHGVVELLLAAGASVDPVDSQQRTPLHAAIAGLAVQEGDASVMARRVQAAQRVVELLIQAGADVNAPCPRHAECYTPLHRCVSAGEQTAAVIERLVSAGADRTRRDPRFERTPAELARTLDLDRLRLMLESDGCVTG